MTYQNKVSYGSRHPVLLSYTCPPKLQMHRDQKYCTEILGKGLSDVEICIYMELHTHTHTTLVYTYVFAPPGRMHRDTTYCAGLLGGGDGDVEIFTYMTSYPYME